MAANGMVVGLDHSQLFLCIKAAGPISSIRHRVHRVKMLLLHVRQTSYRLQLVACLLDGRHMC